jgi:hypothetical protein
MVITPHAIVGAALANLIPDQPALGFGLAFLSHYALDMIPHKDYNIHAFLDKKTKKANSILKNTKTVLSFVSIVTDFIIALLLCIIFFVNDRKSLVLTLIGIAGAVLPDLFQFLFYKFKVQPLIFIQKIHDKLSFDSDKIDVFFGVFSQVIIPLAFLVTFCYVTL